MAKTKLGTNALWSELGGKNASTPVLTKALEQWLRTTGIPTCKA